VNRTIRLLLATAVALPACHKTRQVFPEWRAGLYGLTGTWSAASLIAVATLRDIAEIGTQTVKEVPSPVQRGLKKLYWCQGNLEIRLVVRGAVSRVAKPFVWGELRSGCGGARSVNASSGRSSQIWFLREEAECFRPVVDGGGVFYYELNTEFRTAPSETELARLFLDRSVNGEGLLGESAGVACMILGEQECVKRICSIASAPAGPERGALADYLWTHFRTACR
jgi:hypothetical protein